MIWAWVIRSRRCRLSEADTGREDGLALSGLVGACAGRGQGGAASPHDAACGAPDVWRARGKRSLAGAPWLSQTLASTVELLSFRARKGAGAFETRVMEEIEVATRLTRPYGVTVGAGVDQHAI